MWFENFSPIHDRHIVFGKVDARFQPRDEFQQNLLVGLQPGGERAFHLLRRHAGLIEGSRFDKVAHRFRLRQVKTPVQKPAQGELARFGSARPAVNATFDEVLQDYRSAMAGDLNHVFGSVGVRMAEAGNDNLVENLAALGIAELAHGGALRLERKLAEADELAGDFECAAAGKPNHPQAASAGRRGNGHDGIVVHGFQPPGLAQTPFCGVCDPPQGHVMGRPAPLPHRPTGPFGKSQTRKTTRR